MDADLWGAKAQVSAASSALLRSGCRHAVRLEVHGCAMAMNDREGGDGIAQGSPHPNCSSDTCKRRKKYAGSGGERSSLCLYKVSSRSGMKLALWIEPRVS